MSCCRRSFCVTSSPRRAMSDYEDADFLIDPWASPPKKKAKKDSKKAKKAVKHKKSRPEETDKGAKKKKKKPKFQEVMMEKKKEKRKGKDKKKDKKKKKNKLALNLDGDFAFAENGKLFSFPETSAKEARRKKMVAFASSPSHAHVKRPVSASSTSKESEAAGEDESRSQGGARSQLRPPDSDSQHNSEDMNSQDLFITQKAFRASPSDTSSSEAGDRALSESPRVFTQRDKSQPPTAGETKTRDGAPQHGLWEIKTEREEEIHQFLKCSGETSSQTHQAAESKGPEHGGRRFLDQLLVISPTQDPAGVQRRPSYRPYTGEPARPPASASAATQTENFFTAELSSCLSLCWEKRAAPQGQDEKPLDLSLPRRARQGLCVSLEKPEEEVAERGEQKAPQAKRVAIKEEPSGHGEATPSPQSEADTKSANTTTSSEDDHHCHAGKRDLTQVRAVQLRLNKPFFFKTKGGERSPRPDSPLMKLAQGRDSKTKTCRSRRM